MAVVRNPRPQRPPVVHDANVRGVDGLGGVGSGEGAERGLRDRVNPNSVPLGRRAEDERNTARANKRAADRATG